MADLLEVRWHGRGGQGVKTAALLLADVAFHTGKYVQGFPEYGPERMGAPVTAYNRIANQKIRIHSNIYEPQYAAVVDASLLKSVDVTAGLSPDGGILINSDHAPEMLRGSLRGYCGKIWTIDARAISEALLGAYFPNMPMLAGMIQMTQLMDETEFIGHMKESLQHKFSNKPGVAEGNLAVLQRALREVHAL